MYRRTRANVSSHYFWIMLVISIKVLIELTKKDMHIVKDIALFKYVIGVTLIRHLDIWGYKVTFIW